MNSKSLKLLILSLAGMLGTLFSAPVLATVYVTDGAGGAATRQNVVTEQVKFKKALAAFKKTGVKPENLPKGSGLRVGGEPMFNLQKLVDAKGKTIIPAMYRGIWPISTRIAFVQRGDESFGFHDLATRKFRPIDTKFGWNYSGNGTPSQPTLLLGVAREGRLFDVCFVKADGNCGTLIKRVDGSIGGALDKRSAFDLNSKIIINQRDSANQRFSMTYDWAGQEISGPNPAAIGLAETDARPGEFKSKRSDVINSVLFELENREVTFGDLTTPLYWPMDAQGSPASAPAGFVGMIPIKVNDTAVHYGYVSVVQSAGVNSYHISTGGYPTKDTPQAAAVLATLSNQTSFRDLYFNIGENKNASIAYLDDAGWYFLTNSGDRNDLGARVTYLKPKNPSADPLLAILANSQATQQRIAARNMAITEARNTRQAAISRITARGNTMRAYGILCSKAYHFAKTRSGDDARDFALGYDQLDQKVCDVLPVSLYNSMVASGTIIEKPSEPQPKSEWEKILEAMAVERGTGPRPGATYSCYVSEGRRICGYN